MKKVVLTLAVLFCGRFTYAQSSFIAPNHVPEYSPYVSSIPLELYRSLAVEKQNIYNSNLRLVRREVEDLNEYLLDLASLDESAFEYYRVEFKKWIEQVFRSNPDLSDARVAEAILYNISQFKLAVRKAIRTAR